jgi:hypothetical protein
VPVISNHKEVFGKYLDKVKTIDGAGGSRPAAVVRMFKRWGEFYRSFAKERYVIFSRGGGDWAKLKPSTIARRRNVKKPKARVRSAIKQEKAALGRIAAIKAKLAKRSSDKHKAALSKAYASHEKKVKARTKAQAKLAEGIASIAILIDTATMIAGTNPVLDTSKGGLEKDIPGGIRVGYGGPAPHPGGGKGAKTIADIASYHHEGNAHLPQRRVIVDVPKGSECEELMRHEGETMLAALYKESAG